MAASEPTDASRPESTGAPPIEQRKYPPGKHPNQLAALRKYHVKKGQVLNPKGVNHLTKARSKVEKMLAKSAPDIAKALIELAKDKDGLALQLVAKSILPAPPAQELNVNATITFADLARRAAEIEVNPEPDEPTPDGE